ncbi:uncharacterized protein [Melopsittacus undulatus]|uniref:uncharacterized protein n=1 Tax=Melopsittacus undulatus TaxID=13146 RepID=UPI001243540E|nr:uncharacterized protein LOC115946719 [Melopsittacus undulatus]
MMSLVCLVNRRGGRAAGIVTPGPESCLLRLWAAWKVLASLGTSSAGCKPGRRTCPLLRARAGMLVSLGRWQHRQTRFASAAWRPELQRGGIEAVGLVWDSFLPKVELRSWRRGLGWGAWGVLVHRRDLFKRFLGVQSAQHPHHNTLGSFSPGHIHLYQLQLIVKYGEGLRFCCGDSIIWWPWSKTPSYFLPCVGKGCLQEIGHSRYTAWFLQAPTYLQAATMLVCYLQVIKQL